MIEQHEAAHGPAFTATHRGTSYYCSRDVLGRWCVSSHRLALGRSNVGTCRFFKDLTAVATSIKAFAGLDTLNQVQGVA